MNDNIEPYVTWIVSILFAFVLFSITMQMDVPIEKAILAQELCINVNSKAESFDRFEVTCENKAVIPLKGE